KGAQVDLQEKRKAVSRFNKALKDLAKLEAEKKRIETKIENAKKIIQEFDIKINVSNIQY
ncbi:hypothetical protein, partial [Campylobacter molothri]